MASIGTFKKSGHEFQGEIVDLDCRPVTASVLKGLLANVVETPVNTVNAAPQRK